VSFISLFIYLPEKHNFLDLSVQIFDPCKKA
jgi:hypothetical protein